MYLVVGIDWRTGEIQEPRSSIHQVPGAALVKLFNTLS